MPEDIHDISMFEFLDQHFFIGELLGSRSYFLLANLASYWEGHFFCITYRTLATMTNYLVDNLHQPDF